MRAIFLGAIVLGLALGGLVAGVRCGMAARSNDGAATPAALASVTAQPGISPRATAEAFAAAWSKDSIEALYLLLDAPSQRKYPYELFEAAYASFRTETTQVALTATATRANSDGATLHARLDTAYFGTFEYSTTMRFTTTAGKVLVEWDERAIHPDLVEGRLFRSAIQKTKRGAILDRNGAALAITRDVRMIGLNRAVVQDRAVLTTAIEGLGFSRAAIDKAFESGLGQNQRVPIGPVADDKAEAAVNLIRLPGIILYFESARVHPLGAAAAHVVGYTRELTAEELKARSGQGFRVGDRVGAVGLEASQDGVLAGKTEAGLSLVEANGTTVKTYRHTDGVAGTDVITTLDAAVLTATAKRMGVRAGAAVVMDPRSNAILALYSSPSFDPDAFERNDAAALDAITRGANSPLANRATTGLYSAGSTFKLVTGAAGLLSGAYTTSSQLFCGASWNGVDPPRRNWEGTQGPLTIALGLMRSCNPVFYEIGLTLYNKADGYLAQTARQFGFGVATGVSGLAEEDGLVPDAAWKRKARNEAWFPGDEVNLAIGQGDLLITPLQLVNAYSAFLNRELRAPVILAGGTATSRGAIALTDAQFAHLKLGLQLVTSATGTASAAFANLGYSNFGGKSGTAEDAGSQQHVLFVAFAPLSAPGAVAAVVLDDGQSGSIEAGPIARDIVLAALK